MLRLAEAVDFVDEKKRPRTPEFVARTLADSADRSYVRNYARRPHKAAMGGFRDHFGKRCLAATGRAVQNDIGEPIGFDYAAEQLPGAENVILPKNLIERPGAHPGGQRGGI